MLDKIIQGQTLVNTDVYITVMTILAKLVASESDGLGYTTYVFECLEESMSKYTKYCMCVRFPNWDHRELDLGEIGYLDFNEVRAGIDKWWDGEKMIPYRYSGIHFQKFIKKPDEKDFKYIM